MSQLSYMEKLLDGVDVEWKALGEVCDFKNGFAFKSSLFKEVGLPIIRITNVDGKNISLADVKYFDPSDYKENTASYEISKGDILIAMSGATTGKIGFYAHESPAYLNQRVGKFLPKPKILNNRYLYHYLLSKVEQIYVIAGGGAQPNLSSIALMAKIQIPIPCPDNPEKSLAIQAEIVRILDAFTAMTAELIAELTAELNMRKKQYNYYRDQLLSFDEEEVEWRAMGEIGVFTRGKRFVKADMLSEGVPCIHYGEMYTHYNVWACVTKSFLNNDLAKKLRVAEHGDVIIVAAGETIEDLGKGTAWLGQSDVVFHDACFSYRSPLNSKYIAYFTRTTVFHDQIKKHISSGKISAINANGLSKVKIPIPSDEEQARIVAILDKFDALTTLLQEGLPREIELRQKQYEYYRDLLLSFPQPPSDEVA
ncbi:TPA: restriction endonuclease subunit S [Proteus mirabilis]|nr:restriction endonuclease subunit S [Proteus mirabilis]